METRIKHLTGGKTGTVETFWNVTASARFRHPAGAKINVKYGKGRFSRNMQVQELDGVDFKFLSVGKGSLLGARFRVKLPKTGEVTYDYALGGVAQSFPQQEF